MDIEILVIGLNHSTAPVEIRERVTFPGDEGGALTRSLFGLEGVEEAMILSTCNRAEVIAAVSTHRGDPRECLIEEIGRIHGLEPQFFTGFLYDKTGADAVDHVFRVASSLDSMVLGEPQILGQVKEAYRLAAVANATGPFLNRLMHRAFFTAKRVRNETGVGLAAVSVAYVAVELAAKILGELGDKRVLLIGAGEMAELAARHLLNKVQEPIVVVNRTYDSAVCLATELAGSAMDMGELAEGLAQSDVVISSTGSCDPVITVSTMKQVMKRRRYRPIFLIDIAIPRDVEPSVNDLDGVYLYNIDDLQSVVNENVGERRQEALRAGTIVAEEVLKFVEWTKSLDSAPTIVALKEKLEEIRAGELAKMNGKLGDLEPGQSEAVEMVTRAIINKIAHDPIVFLKEAASRSKRTTYLDLAQRLFNLDGLTTAGEARKDESQET